MEKHAALARLGAGLVCAALLTAPLFGADDLHEAESAVAPPGGPWATVPEDETFRFVVIGDTRPSVRAVPPRTADFIRQIDEINLLRPDFVIDVGDLIIGDSDLKRQEAMWDEFDQIVKRFTVPLVLVVGNHDVWTPETLGIYRRRYGPTYFSFNHKGVHFIALDSEAMDEQGQVIDRITGEQMAWLRRDLAAHAGAKATFVFLHKPLWQDMYVKPTAAEHWWSDVHPLLARHGVDAVFAGHWHTYTKYPARDGVEYYVTGGGGAEVDADETVGGFFHYMFVTVRGRSWRTAVIKPDAVHPDTVVTSQNKQYLQGLDALENVRLAPSDKAQPLELAFRNAHGEPSTLTMSLKAAPGSGWKFTPELQTAVFNACATKTFRFAVSCDAMKAYPPPQYALKFSTKWVPADIILASHEATLRVVPFRTGVVRRTKQPPQIDGKLDDPCWEQAKALDEFVTLGDGLSAGAGTRVRLLRDERTLYLAAVCDEPHMESLKAEADQRDGDVVADDSLQFFFDADGDPATYVRVAVNSLAALYDARHAPSVSPSAAKHWNAPWQAAVAKGTGKWTVELAVELKHLSAAAPAPGGAWGFNVVRSRRAAGMENTCWSLCYDAFAEPENFGTLRFD